MSCSTVLAARGFVFVLFFMRSSTQYCFIRAYLIDSYSIETSPKTNQLSLHEGSLMTMSPLYPCGKPCSRGTHNETVKNLGLFSSIIYGIMMKPRVRISAPWECFQFFNQIENSNSQILQSDWYCKNREVWA